MLGAFMENEKDEDVLIGFGTLIALSGDKSPSRTIPLAFKIFLISFMFFLIASTIVEVYFTYQVMSGGWSVCVGVCVERERTTKRTTSHSSFVQVRASTTSDKVKSKLSRSMRDV